jgi:(p)ppGpp synthase/HD superfamily hydrolase
MKQHVRKNLPWSQELYLKAMRFAAEAHKNQKIPGTDLPYVLHISSVCMEIMSAICVEEIGKPDLAIQCAILHDTMEDAGIKFDDIKSLFGNEVAEGVMALTKNKKIEKNVRMADSIARIKLQPREIWMVKLADRITNLQPPPPHWTRDRINRYRIEAAYILEELGESSPLLSERFGKKIEDYPEQSS